MGATCSSGACRSRGLRWRSDNSGSSLAHFEVSTRGVPCCISLAQA